ncbi:hypothetical protein [Streptomyces hirsutus]|uniref:hypothetical protein n=1 Tax=Streptomyces hirsutus TaxID=35620 RepID=UPI0033A9F822
MTFLHVRRTRTTALAAVAAAVALAPLLIATDADALGNNRAVGRSCGTNYVSSGHNGTATEGHSWAQTTKQSGTCAGRLSAALERNDGYWSTRVYGTNQSAYATARFNSRAASGLHWGCDDCNVTRS